MELASRNVRLCRSSSSEKRKYSSINSIAGIVMIYMITATCIVHSCNVASLAQGVVLDSYKCVAFDARQSPSDQRYLISKDEENMWFNISWDNDMQFNESMQQVFVFNTSQSNYTVRNTIHKQDIRVNNDPTSFREAFLRQNFSEIFTHYSTLIKDGSQIKVMYKDIDLLLDKNRQTTVMSVMLEQNLLNNQQMYFKVKSGATDFCNRNNKRISSILQFDRKDVTNVTLCNNLRIEIVIVLKNILVIEFQEHISSFSKTMKVSTSIMLDDERLFFHPKSISSRIIGSFISQSFFIKRFA